MNMKRAFITSSQRRKTRMMETVYVDKKDYKSDVPDGKQDNAGKL